MNTDFCDGERFEIHFQGEWRPAVYNEAMLAFDTDDLGPVPRSLIELYRSA